MADDNHGVPRPGDELDVTIDSVAFGGDGVARRGKYVIFVPDVIPGERVRVRVTAAKRSYGRGVPVRVMESSPDRVEPRCEVYAVCGGCQYQHVSYKRSLEFKEQQVRDLLLRIGRLAVDDVRQPIRPAPEPYGYRAAVALHVTKREDTWEAGYFARDNRTFVPVVQCPIATSGVNRLLAQVGKFLNGFDKPDRIKGIIIRSAGDETLIHPIYRTPRRLRSGNRLSYRYKELELSYGPESFFQVNHAMIPDLIDLAGQALEPVPRGTFIDLYAGVGLFALALAGRFQRVIGIEAGEEAVACFEANVRENRIGNVSVIHGAVEAKLGSVRREIESGPASVLVDPPREGLSPKVVQFLKEAPVESLVYVSCNPATLARDLKKLSAAYTFRNITPLDMFPQTAHIETVSVLEQAGRR
jgi:23S rRNA (uracil1939-C5)-methyltransferase